MHQKTPKTIGGKEYEKNHSYRHPDSDLVDLIMH